LCASSRDLSHTALAAKQMVKVGAVAIVRRRSRNFRLRETSMLTNYVLAGHDHCVSQIINV
jgi:hypothetical protein